jgi:hypothetical protein
VVSVTTPRAREDQPRGVDGMHVGRDAPAVVFLTDGATIRTGRDVATGAPAGPATPEFSRSARSSCLIGPIRGMSKGRCYARCVDNRR